MEIPARVVKNSCPGGDFSVKSHVEFALFVQFFLRENDSNLLLIRKNRILTQWLGQE